jgi:hypothetical protein
VTLSGATRFFRFGAIAMKYVKRVLILYALGPPLVVVGSIVFSLIKAAITGDLWLAVGAVAMCVFLMTVIGCVWCLAQWLMSNRG